MIAESIQHHSSFNIIHRETMFKVDVFIPRPRPFLQAQLARVGELDLAYLRNWAAELHVSDLLKRALKESS